MGLMEIGLKALRRAYARSPLLERIRLAARLPEAEAMTGIKTEFFYFGWEWAGKSRHWTVRKFGS
jgi:hypothetical protein